MLANIRPNQDEASDPADDCGPDEALKSCSQHSEQRAYLYDSDLRSNMPAYKLPVTLVESEARKANNTAWVRVSESTLARATQFVRVFKLAYISGLLITSISGFYLRKSVANQAV